MIGKSSLLISESPLQVLPSLATKIGLNEAIILQQIHYWLNHSKNFIKDRYWVYNSYEEWKEQFPFWSKDTIKRALTSLEKQELIFTDKFSEDKFDHRKWYSINYDVLQELEICTNRSVQNALIAECKMPSSQSAKCPDLYKEQRLHSEITNKLLSKKSIREDRFEEFYEVYPRKEARGAAEKAWKKLSQKEQAEVIRKAERYFVLTKEKNIEHKFIPLPATWLNSKRWLDEELERKEERERSHELSYDDFAQKNNEPIGKMQKSVYTAVGQATYVSWFSKAKFLQDASVLTIDFPTKFIKDWVSVHFKSPILTVVSKMGIDKIEFIHSGEVSTPSISIKD